jgi:ribosomal protein S12 methylthiotransferase accessory factor
VDKPRLKANLVPRVVGRDRVFLLAENGYYLVQGEAAVAIVPYLDGTYTPAEIVEAVSGQVSFSDVILTLSKFQRFGHLVESPVIAGDRRATAAWDERGIDPSAATGRLAGATVSLTAVGDVALAPVASALRDAGITVVEESRTDIGTAKADLTVVVTDEYLDEELAPVDAKLRELVRPWLLLKPTGTTIWVGPYFVPGETGCWTCLHERLDGNRQVEQFIRIKASESDVVRTSIAALGWTQNVAANLAATLVAEALVTGQAPALSGKLMTVDTRTFDKDTHTLIRQPQCPACGDPSLVGRSPEVHLKPSPVHFTADGGHRVMSPEVTFKRLEKHVSPLLGAVNMLRLLGDEDNGITYSYAAGHNFAAPSDNIDMLRRNLRGQSGGKGRTDIQARVSAACEAIERYSGVWRDIYPTTQAAYGDLGPEKAVPMAELLHYSDGQYANRREWNKDQAGRLQTVPDPLADSTPISWTKAWSLTEERERLVASAYTWFGHPDLYEHFFCFADANGNAAGNTLEEAILQGFCELVERDAVALWWYNRIRHRGFDLDSLHEPYIDTLRDFYASMNREIWVLDITTDLGIPSFVAVSRRTDSPVEDILLGFGAHLDVRVAVLRALTEVNQFLPAVVKRNGDGSTEYWEDDRDTLNWWQTATIVNQPWVLPDPNRPPTTYATHGRLYSDDVADDVRFCIEKTRAAGLEVIVLDQTRPDIELNVAKVIVPGMRHFWRRLAPGRLYDVPVQQGWLSAPIPEDQLNPISVFF